MRLRGSASDTRTAATTKPSGDCPRGKVYRQLIHVERANGEYDQAVVLIACKPDGDSTIVDTNAQSYEDLDDFSRTTTCSARTT